MRNFDEPPSLGDRFEIQQVGDIKTIVDTEDGSALTPNQIVEFLNHGDKIYEQLSKALRGTFYQQNKDL